MPVIEVDLHKIIIDEKRQDQAIVLKERGGSRQLPIMIGLVEASSIKMKLSEVETPRPLTHDLIVSVINGLEATPEKLIIDKIIDHTFHAKLVLKTKDGETKHIDSRPSDGIAIAVRTSIPIFVEEEVLKSVEIPKF